MKVYLNLDQLLTPRIQYVVKDSFSTANKIKDIPQELFEEGYRFVLFDVESLFTSPPLNKTVNIVLDQIYNKKLLTENKHQEMHYEQTSEGLLHQKCHHFQ